MKKSSITENNKVMIYSDNIDLIVLLMARLKNSMVDINMMEFGDKISRNLLMELNENPPELVFIDNENPEKSLALNKLIKEEGTISDLPVVFYGGKDEDARLEAIGSGVLDVLDNPNTNESFLKLLNYIELGKKIAGSKNIDMLTGLLTRRAGEKLLEENIFMAKESKKELSIAVMDIDNMKQINDVAGKRNGDELIKEFAALIRHVIGVEGKNFAYRYSGKKFVVAFVNEEPSQALSSILSLQESFKEFNKEYDINTSFSAGLAPLCDEADDIESILNNALASQRAAKRDGKGLVYIHNSPEIETKQKNILIIGEDKTLRGILTRRYNNLGFNVFQASEPNEASALLEKNHINATISDFEPFMQLTDYFRKKNGWDNGRRVIVLTSSRIESTFEKIYNNGADDYIQKPFSIVELDLKLKKLLGR